MSTNGYAHPEKLVSTEWLAGHLEDGTLRLEVIEDADLASLLGIESPFFIAVDRVRTNASDGHAISIERSRLPFSEGASLISREAWAARSPAPGRRCPCRA